MKGRSLGLGVEVGGIMKEGKVGIYYRFFTNHFSKLIEKRLEKPEIYPNSLY